MILYGRAENRRKVNPYNLSHHWLICQNALCEKLATKSFHSNVIISHGDISKADRSPCCLLNGPPFPPAIKATSGPRQGGDGRAKPSSPFSIDSQRNEQVEVIVWDSVWSEGDSRKAKNKMVFLSSFNQYTGNPFLSIHFCDCVPNAYFISLLFAKGKIDPSNVTAVIKWKLWTYNITSCTLWLM